MRIVCQQNLIKLIKIAFTLNESCNEDASKDYSFSTTLKIDELCQETTSGTQTMNEVIYEEGKSSLSGGLYC